MFRPIFFALALAAGPLADRCSAQSSALFRQACLDATTDGLVVNIAAHPDDESARTMVMLRRKYGLRTVTIYTTSGGGGQNAIGRRIGKALAMIRVRETLAAARHTGVEVHWLGLPDFGYSKTSEESMRSWGRSKLIDRMRTRIEELDPDLVFTNHRPDSGHGHHRASAVAIHEILVARGADRKTPLYQKIFVSGSEASPTTEPDVVFDPSELDPARGTTYARQAHDGLLEHRTQGPWTEHDPADIDVERWTVVLPQGKGVESNPFEHVGSDLAEPAFRRVWSDLGHDVGRLELALRRFGEDRRVAEHVRDAQALLPLLRAAGKRLDGIADGVSAQRRLHRRLSALQQVILLGSGVQVEASLASEGLPEFGEGIARVVVHARNRSLIRDVRAECRGVRGKPIDPKAPDESRLQIAFPVSPRSVSAEDGGVSAEPDWVEVDVSFALAGQAFTVRHRLAGRVVPTLQAKWDRDVALVPRGERTARIFVLRLAYSGDSSIESAVELEAPEGFEVTASPEFVKLSATRREMRVLVSVTSNHGLADRGSLRAKFSSQASVISLEPIKVERAPDLRVGLVRGPDDTLHRTLEDLGVSFELLDEKNLAVADLGEFSTVVLDIRSYHHRTDLEHHRDRLLDFCRQGGRILVFYHKPGEWNKSEDRPLLAPYALEVSNLRVSQEDARVRFLKPQHRLWNVPYHITEEDFRDWSQERGLNFPSEWDEKAWTPILAMADDGEDPLEGALLVAGYGNGDYVYCSLALYRQLRRGHRGAARILVNLLTQ